MHLTRTCTSVPSGKTQSKLAVSISRWWSQVLAILISCAREMFISSIWLSRSYANFVSEFLDLTIDLILMAPRGRYGATNMRDRCKFLTFFSGTRICHHKQIEKAGQHHLIRRQTKRSSSQWQQSPSYSLEGRTSRLREQCSWKLTLYISERLISPCRVDKSPLVLSDSASRIQPVRAIHSSMGRIEGDLSCG